MLLFSLSPVSRALSESRCHLLPCSLLSRKRPGQCLVHGKCSVNNSAMNEQINNKRRSEMPRSFWPCLGRQHSTEAGLFRRRPVSNDEWKRLRVILALDFKMQRALASRVRRFALLVRKGILERGSIIIPFVFTCHEIL